MYLACHLLRRLLRRSQCLLLLPHLLRLGLLLQLVRDLLDVLLHEVSLESPSPRLAKIESVGVHSLVVNKPLRWVSMFFKVGLVLVVALNVLEGKVKANACLLVTPSAVNIIASEYDKVPRILEEDLLWSVQTPLRLLPGETAPVDVAVGRDGHDDAQRYCQALVLLVLILHRLVDGFECPYGIMIRMLALRDEDLWRHEEALQFLATHAE